MNISVEHTEAAKRHAAVMSQASFEHGQANPADANPMIATIGAALQLGVMVSQMIDMGIVPPNNAGRIMDTMARLAEDAAVASIGFKSRG